MEKDLFKVSVVIPVYHVDRDLFDRCLLSIQNQTEKNLEIQIVFDEKAEVYTDILTKYVETGLQIEVEEQDHCGVSSARNKGMKKARGKWIAFVDADDWLEKDAIMKLVSAGETDKAEIVMGEHVMEYGKTSKIHEYKKQQTIFEKNNKEIFVKDILRPQTGAGFVWGKVFLKRFLIEGNIYFNPNLAAAEDAEFMFRASCASQKIIYLNSICYHYWFNAGSAVRRYQKNYADKYILSMEAINQDIETNGGKGYCRETYYSCVLYHLLLIVVNYSFHPDSGIRDHRQITEFKRLLKMPIFDEALKHIHYEDFSKTRQITLWCIKNHCYRLVKLIANVRHMQFKRYSKQ